MTYNNNISTLFIFALHFLVVQASNTLDLSCKLSITPVNTDRIDIKQIVSFVQSQEIDAKLFDDAAVTEAQIIKETLEYKNGLDNEDIHLSVTELIQKYGFPVEVYTVTTPDGYIVTMHRIPGKNSPVLLMPGLFGSSDDYVIAGPNSALAYLLAKAGHDVWMGNPRGNKHSRKHVSKSPECADFWDFSWHEIGIIDLPTMIDFILEKTGKVKLSYVGFSEGTATFFVMVSELPEYNDKISIMSAFSPIAYMSHLKSPIFRFPCLDNADTYLILEVIGHGEVFPDNLFMKAVRTVLCGNNPLAKIVCSTIFPILAGFDRGQMNITNLPVVFGHTPAGSSAKQVIHFMQLVSSARFRKFDFGQDENLKVYGSKQPPDYVLENIRVPVVLFHSYSDWVSNVTDVLKLKDKLQNVVATPLIPNYNHYDYITAKNVKQLVYEPLLELIETYS